MGATRVVIVGASAAGLRCAARLRRLAPQHQITVVEHREEFSVAACGLPYVLSGDIDKPEALRETSYGSLRDVAYFAAVKGIEVLNGWRARLIDTGAQQVELQQGETKRRLEYDELVLATGGRARRLPGLPDHPRIQVFHTLDDLAPLLEGLRQGKTERVAVIGAGPIGVELAEALTALWGAEVVLLEREDRPLPAFVDPEVGELVARALRAEDVDLRCNQTIERVEADDSGVVVHAGENRIEADVAVLALGVDPEVELARLAGLKLGRSGAILVDERLATSAADIWAAGDCVEVRHAVTGEPCHIPLGSLANRQGRTLANILSGEEDRFPAVAGAFAVKVFDHNLATVGLTRTQALARGMDARSVWSSAPDRADYWPEAKEIQLQLVYERRSGRLLGLQVFGEGEVCKRIDAVTGMIARGASLDELSRHEHAYAPPYAPAIDPVATLAMVARNQESGVGPLPPTTAIEGADWLDVRRAEEREAMPLELATRDVPLDQLREQVELLKGQSWRVLCGRGTRSAEAVRILAAAGIEARYLGGGLLWQVASGRVDAENRGG